MRAILGIFERLQEQREHCDHVELMVYTGQEQYNSKSRIISRAEQNTFQRRVFPTAEQSISKWRAKYFQTQSKVFSNVEQSIAITLNKWLRLAPQGSMYFCCNALQWSVSSPRQVPHPTCSLEDLRCKWVGASD